MIGGISLSFISFGIYFNCHDVSVDRAIESSTSKANPFPRVVHVISTAHMKGHCC